MKLLFYLHHPAQFHLLKHIIKYFATKNKIIVVATKKDVLEDLLADYGIDFINVLPKGRKDNKLAIALGLLKQDISLLKICIRQKPEILIGTSTEITHIGWLLKIPSIFLNEDDISVISLVGKVAYPFAKHLLLPNITDSGKWSKKVISYNSYHELAYLHPNNFTADKKIAEKYVDVNNPYFILRFAKLGAHHDTDIKGISDEIAMSVIKILKSYGKVFITSERELAKEFEKYRLSVNPLDMHNVMAFSSMYIGDSQTMAAEAGVLGVPFIRFNDFVGRIGYLDELENKYQLGFGIKTNEIDKLLNTIRELVSKDNLKEIYQERRQKMLSEKIDYAQFLKWLIENYPNSVDIMKNNPDYQYNF
ncbi:MAG: DUF354 domain-containing protein [Bacteroidales bacterium]|nr:DUF354 domain-containing protein [Bacteroidales bacterium]